ncbi:MAG: GntR family transcriptional regulator [Hyphomicrobiales bacterium]|nr:MAG: GntR family transcriptional regulator [Hyphomicrobiales bacterium]
MAEATGLQRPDRRRPEPLWHQAEMVLRSFIERGEWTSGSQIPTEDRLCEMLGISRITVRHALRNIEEAGLLRREHGRGTFVRSATVVAGVRGLTSFTDEMRTLALAASTRLIEAHRVPANEEMADALEIALGEPVVQLKRLRLGNGLPIGIQTSHLPEARVPGLYDDAGNVQSLYAWLKERCEIIPVKAKEVYRVGSVDAADAEIIQLPAGTPAFEVERIAFDARGPFEYALSTMRADRYEIRSTLYV